MSFPRYPKYKDSGVEWLREVPEHWDVRPVASLATIINGYPFDSERFDPAVGYPLIRIRDLGSDQAEAYYNGEMVERATVTSADVLIGMDGDFNVGRWRGAGIAMLNQRMCCIRGSTPLVTRLLEYALPRPLANINAVTYSTTVKHLSSSQVEKIRVAIPPAEVECEAIATFLDSETAKIDALIAEQQRLIELLQEKRQAVISQAVTKGLNPDAPMKDSGVEWLGEVPEHWDVKMLKYLSPQVTVGIVVEPSKHYVTEGVPALRSLNVTGDGVVMDNVVFISSEANELHRKSRLHAGDIVAVRSGQPGTCAIIPPNLDGCNCVDLIIIRKPETCTSHFLRWYLSSDSAKVQFGSGAEGAIQQHFNVSTASQLLVAVPPLSEQDAIVAFVDDATHTLDTLRDEAQNAIALLQERRSALISAAVTGQIDVRGLTGSEAA